MWTTAPTHEVARREVSNLDMIPEVLRALRHQVGSGAEVIHAEWAKPATAVPSTVLPDDLAVDDFTPLHQLQHGPVAAHSCLHVQRLDVVDDAPWVAVEGDVVWAKAVADIFPQAKHIPLVRALVHDAVQWHRLTPSEAWTFRVDVRHSGAVMVATEGESLRWIHHLKSGATAEDALYAMVNAAHRSGADVQQSRVRWSGEETMVEGWSRFLDVVSSGEHVSDVAASNWQGVFQSLQSCV